MEDVSEREGCEELKTPCGMDYLVVGFTAWIVLYLDWVLETIRV